MKYYAARPVLNKAQIDCRGCCQAQAPERNFVLWQN